ncbi:hypothetical protein COL30_05335 [Bacillus pseudomycoides]|uniref:hypothetical protein n=1 Tax=Bacillus pseudomycoides TaxID=64104 RepID=UPI000BEC8203|nr:hypothetical protein [Bacillus pseudomycoides]PEA84069.1 hypothetical protein CON99_08405 [Bacillus pseudomycoides]PEK26280.1 hypothetical protein CN693_09525 [Bacillus pseudomycoides]PEO14188.1 hypothetical protein CN542_18625 [Bacillus pseudomycoides]PEP60655.1 hypothetical protein CN591_19370 [Bacillus pseudomycoides]PFW67463.1 hypothetical protein COL25_16250 [Bacillus pseudomycoides]
MRGYRLSKLRTISLGMFWLIGLFGWTHLILALFTLGDIDQVWMIAVPMLVLLVVVLFDCIVLGQKLQFRTVLFIWFLGAGYGGGLDFIQQQHSPILLTIFHVFTYTPALLGLLYLILISREKRSEQ